MRIIEYSLKMYFLHFNRRASARFKSNSSSSVLILFFPIDSYAQIQSPVISPYRYRGETLDPSCSWPLQEHPISPLLEKWHTQADGSYIEAMKFRPFFGLRPIGLGSLPALVDGSHHQPTSARHSAEWPSATEVDAAAADDPFHADWPHW